MASPSCQLGAQLLDTLKRIPTLSLRTSIVLALLCPIRTFDAHTFVVCTLDGSRPSEKLLSNLFPSKAGFPLGKSIRKVVRAPPIRRYDFGPNCSDFVCCRPKTSHKNPQAPGPPPPRPDPRGWKRTWPGTDLRLNRPLHVAGVYDRFSNNLFRCSGTPLSAVMGGRRIVRRRRKVRLN